MRSPQRAVKGEKLGILQKMCRFRSAVSQILSTAGRNLQLDAHLSIPQAESPPKRGAAYPGSLDGPPDPLFCLAPDWVYPASIVTFGAVSSYLPFSPLPQASPRRLFSVTLSVTLGCPHAPPLSQGFLPYGVRTFLSSPKEQANAHTPKSTGATCPAHRISASGKFRTVLIPKN